MLLSQKGSLLLQVFEWYREGVCGGGFYELDVKLLTEDGQVCATT